MTASKAKTVTEYLAELDPIRAETMSTVRKVILKNLPQGYEEVMQYGMISYIIPFSKYPHTYNKQPLAIASLAAQKNYFALHLMCIYSNHELYDWFTHAYQSSGKKLDMGKACVRFKKADDLALDVIAELIAKVTVDNFIQMYEASRKLAKGNQKAS